MGVCCREHMLSSISSNPNYDYEHDDVSKISYYTLIYLFRCMPNKKGFHIGLPKSWGFYQVPQDPIKIASMMLDFLEGITKELWWKSNAFVQSQSIFIHFRYNIDKITLFFFNFWFHIKFLHISNFCIFRLNARLYGIKLQMNWKNIKNLLPKWNLACHLPTNRSRQHLQL